MTSKTDIMLQSSDGHIIQVELQVARMSELIKEMLDLGVGEGDFGSQSQEVKPEVVPLANVKKEILEKVVKWAYHHKDDPVKAPEEAKEENANGTPKLEMSSWDEEFFKVDVATLYHLILAANYLDMKGLLDGTSMAIAKLLKASKSPEEIRAMFHSEKDLTPEQEEQIRKENEWCGLDQR